MWRLTLERATIDIAIAVVSNVPHVSLTGDRHVRTDTNIVGVLCAVVGAAAQFSKRGIHDVRNGYHPVRWSRIGLGYR